ncbi:MAG: tRNA (N(6)-L-threonylcarbamoyladenosine(37)-C(2))-methylthiotransferase MtaB [Deltaproteobacteria bacterium]|nr:tRNA (N(6)-L-threonylcarbamoyladenosine(37)-C(2))-methylthiotransferase MtaB [Deltaproteobacteria bacterium]
MKAALLTLGCKVNQAESSAMMEDLIQAGYQSASALEADLVVLNTCAVTQRAESEALTILRRLKRQNPRALVVATGCLAQLNPHKLLKDNLADLALGQDQKASLVELLKLPKGQFLVTTDFKPSFFYHHKPERTRAFQKIQDGCDARCSYCAVPLARGPSRSQGLEKVIEGLEGYLAMGLKEIVLTGIHLGQWGARLMPPNNLETLLEAVDKKLGSKLKTARIRLSSIEPLEAPLVEKALKRYSWLCPHLHLPIQSGSDKILKAMNRPYDSKQACDIILSLSQQVQGLNLGTDLMVGFPGETKEDFELSYNLVKSLPFGYLHVFPFSPRPQTEAQALKQITPEKLKRAAAAKLRALDQEKRALFLLANQNKPRVALIENTTHRLSGRIKLLTDNYIQALLPIEIKAEPGSLMEVYIGSSLNRWRLAEAYVDHSKNEST